MLAYLLTLQLCWYSDCSACLTVGEVRVFNSTDVCTVVHFLRRGVCMQSYSWHV